MTVRSGQIYDVFSNFVAHDHRRDELMNRVFEVFFFKDYKQILRRTNLFEREIQRLRYRFTIHERRFQHEADERELILQSFRRKDEFIEILLKSLEDVKRISRGREFLDLSLKFFHESEDYQTKYEETLYELNELSEIYTEHFLQMKIQRLKERENSSSGDMLAGWHEEWIKKLEDDYVKKEEYIKKLELIEEMNLKNQKLLVVYENFHATYGDTRDFLDFQKSCLNEVEELRQQIIHHSRAREELEIENEELKRKNSRLTRDCEEFRTKLGGLPEEKRDLVGFEKRRENYLLIESLKEELETVYLENEYLSSGLLQHLNETRNLTSLLHSQFEINSNPEPESSLEFNLDMRDFESKLEANFLEFNEKQKLYFENLQNLENENRDLKKKLISAKELAEHRQKPEDLDVKSEIFYTQLILEMKNEIDFNKRDLEQTRLEQDTRNSLVHRNMTRCLEEIDVYRTKDDENEKKIQELRLENSKNHEILEKMKSQIGNLRKDSDSALGQIQYLRNERQIYIDRVEEFAKRRVEDIELLIKKN